MWNLLWRSAHSRDQITNFGRPRSCEDPLQSIKKARQAQIMRILKGVKNLARAGMSCPE